MTQQGRVRRSSLELHPGAVPSSCYPDTVAGPFTAGFDDALSLLLSTSAAAVQNGYGHDPAAAALHSKAQVPFLTSAGQAVSSPVADGCFDAGLMECEEPGPLPCLPRTRALGSGGPYGSSAAALMMQQQQQQPGAGYQGAPNSNGRQGRPRRHSVTIGMLNEHQQQQQAAAYAAALAAAQQGAIRGNGGALPGPAAAGGPGGLGMLGPLPPAQQPPGVASPAKQQLQALSNVQAMAAAAQLGMGASSLLASLGLQPEQLQQQLAASSAMAMGSGDLQDLGVQFSMNAPRMPNAGSCRRHSWAPTGANGSAAYAQALLLQQQQRQLAAAAAAAMGDPRGILGMNGLSSLNGMNGVNGVNGMNGVNGIGLAAKKQKGVGPRPPLAGAYTNGAPYLNGHAPNGSGPPSGGFAGLSAAAAAAAMAQLSGFQNIGALAGLDGGDQLTRLIQLKQQAGLAGQPVLDPYQLNVEGLLDAGGLGQSPALLPSLAGAGLGPVAAGLLPSAAAAVTQLTQLGFDAEGLSPAAAAAAASMYTPLKVNGVTLDSQLLVAPFADNWDMMCGQGQAGVTPQQVAAVAAAGLGAGAMGYGVMSPRAGGSAGGLGMQGVAACVPGKHPKGLPTRSGSCGSSSSNGSSGNGHSAPLASVPLGAAPLSNGRSVGAAAAASSSSSAALAAASVAAAVPPIANVCSDAPWDLKKAAEEDAKVLAAQQGSMQKLVSALEQSDTLAKVQAEQAAANPDPAGNAAGAQGASDRAQPVLFGYQLPDTGTDAWGGSSSSAALESTPGCGCISQEPSNKLFVGNIGWWVTEDDLLHWFSRFGTVMHVKIMYNSRKMHKPKDKWRSREYGFIDYATPEEAAKAIVWMDGVELPDLMKDTCGIIVQYAKPTGSNGHSGEGGGSHGQGSGGTPNGCINGSSVA